MKIGINDKILVTGGAGFIGSALIHALNQRGLKNIWVSDYLGSDERFRNLIPLQFADYIEASKLTEQFLGGKVSIPQMQYVFHLGACSSTTESNAQYLIENNYEYTKQLAQWSWNSQARFVYASSAATYGDGVQGMDDDHIALHTLRPLNMYGYSKHLFDLWALNNGGLKQSVGLKYFNVFGPNEHHKNSMQSVVYKAYNQIQQQGFVNLFKSYHPEYADGCQKRDFLYVKDAVAMTIHLAETDSAHGIFNLGSGTASTWLELITPLFKAMDKAQDIRFIDMPYELRKNYQYYTQANIQKLIATGYRQSIHTLSAAVEDYVKHYLSTGRYLGDEPINISVEI